MPGVYRFLQKSWRLIVEDNESKPEAGQLRPNLSKDGPGDPELERALHKLIKKVSYDLERMAFNTAISAMMVFVNEAQKDPAKLGKSQGRALRADAGPVRAAPGRRTVAALRPRQDAGRMNPWPAYDEALTKDASIELAVQVNGKVKAKVTVASDASEDAIKAAAQEAIAADLAGKTVAKVVVVKGRLVNVVVK